MSTSLWEVEQNAHFFADNALYQFSCGAVYQYHPCGEIKQQQKPEQNSSKTEVVSCEKQLNIAHCHSENNNVPYNFTGKQLNDELDQGIAVSVKLGTNNFVVLELTRYVSVR